MRFPWNKSGSDLHVCGKMETYNGSRIATNESDSLATHQVSADRKA